MAMYNNKHTYKTHKNTWQTHKHENGETYFEHETGHVALYILKNSRICFQSLFFFNWCRI